MADPGVVTPPFRPARGAYGPVPAVSRAEPSGIVLMTAPLLLGGGTMLARSTRLVDERSLGAIDLSPADADARGIKEGDGVEVRSRNGAVQARAHVEPAMPRGRAFLAENAPGVRTTLLLAWNDLLPQVEVTKR